MYDDYSYLIHSAKGSTWSKGDHKYISKEKKNGKWRYIYKMAQKAADDATRDEIARRAKENEEAARVNGSKTLAETKERRAFEKEAARREKVTRSNREQQARVNARSKEMADYSEGRRLKETLSSRGYKKEIQGNPSNEYLRELESNTRKNRW